jgi:hypothetical protein
MLTMPMGISIAVGVTLAGVFLRFEGRTAVLPWRVDFFFI